MLAFTPAGLNVETWDRVELTTEGFGIPRPHRRPSLDEEEDPAGLEPTISSIP